MNITKQKQPHRCGVITSRGVGWGDKKREGDEETQATMHVTDKLFCASLSGSVVSDSATPWTVARQAPLSMEFSRQEYWSGFPCPPPGDLPDPGMEPVFPTSAGGFFTC